LQCKKVEINLDPNSEVVKELERFSVSEEQIYLAQELGITIDDIREGRRRGLVAVEVLQAAKWGLTPQEFFILKLQLQEPAIAAIGKLALHPDGEKAIAALNPDRSGASSSEIITGQSSRGIQGLPSEEIKAFKLENLGAILQAFQNFSRNNDRILAYIDRVDDDVVNYLINELDFDRSKYNVRGSIRDYFTETGARELGGIDSEAIDALADNLSREVWQLVLNYKKDYDKISDDTRKVFPNLSAAELALKINQQRNELSRDYTKRLHDRAAAILRSEERFQDDALRILVDLRTETIQSLDLETRAKLIEQLGINNNLNATVPNAPQFIAQRCLSDPDIFDRERFCHGLARLVSSALTGPSGIVPSETVETSISLLENLAGGQKSSIGSPDNSNSRHDNLISTNADNNNSIVVNTTPVIQRSAIEYLGSLNGLRAGINSSNTLHSVLLARLATNDDELGVIETSVATYLTMPPEESVAELIKTLRTNPTQQAAAVKMVTRLAQAAYGNEDYSRWREPLKNEELIDALVSIASISQSAEVITNAISAIGHTRTNDEAAIALLRETLTNPGPLERRITAAHALGNVMSTQGVVVDGLDEELRNIVIDGQEPSELRVVAAYALSKFDDNDDEGINTLSLLQRMEIANSLIRLYEDAQETVPTGNDWLISPNTQKAMILYALGQMEIASRTEADTSMAVRNMISRIATIYAEALEADNPIAVRAMAATYAHKISLWNDDLVNALIAAFEDPNLAVRYAAVESVRIRPEGALENRVNPDLEGRLFEALNTVFWDEREYTFIRLRAGLALDNQQRYPVEGADDRYPEEPDDPLTGAISTETPSPENQEFVDMLNALKALDENSIGFRTSSSDAILQALRSAEFLGQFDEFFNEQLLLEILEAIRLPAPIVVSRTQDYRRNQRPWICNIRPNRQGCNN